jgi:tRNA wybutosine-synthesizing protein 3
MDKFNQRKESILNKEDKSEKGNWDPRIISLCEKINSLENYYTTSSCSGRIVVVKDQNKKEKGIFEFVSHDEISFESFSEEMKNFKENLKFKQDPFILHVSCREFEDAKKLIEKGLKAGIKRCGVISLGENIIVEINSTEKLEFPLVKEGEVLVSEKFLIEVLDKVNKNLKKGWEKIEKLKNLMS